VVALPAADRAQLMEKVRGFAGEPEWEGGLFGARTHPQGAHAGVAGIYFCLELPLKQRSLRPSRRSSPYGQQLGDLC